MPDFYTAANRHFNDGDHLHASNRVPNAVQLWAYGAECTLKAIALKQKHFSLSASGRPDNGFAIHIDRVDTAGQQELLSLYNAMQSGPNGIAGPISAFQGWKIDARYETGSQLQPVAAYSSDAI
ncbi:hypothetical protein D9M72_612250 [compost metagenome]